MSDCRKTGYDFENMEIPIHESGGIRLTAIAVPDKSSVISLFLVQARVAAIPANTSIRKYSILKSILKTGLKRSRAEG